MVITNGVLFVVALLVVLTFLTVIGVIHWSF